MSLIDEIVDLAVSDQNKLSVVLRKCLVFSSKVGNEKLQDWVQSELNGYPDTNSLPPYRIIGIQAQGHFFGGFGAEIRNAALPPAVLPENLRWWAKTAYLTQPISSYESFLDGNSDSVRISWPQDLVLHLQSKFYEGYALQSAWQVIGQSNIVGLVDTVRNRVLSFALEIQKEFGNSTEVISKEEMPEVDRAVINHIYGGNVVITARADNFNQIGQALTVSVGNIQSLKAVLNEVGIDEGQIEELEAAILSDVSSRKSDEIGPKTSSWLTKALSKAGSGALKVTGDVARNVITKAILDYYNIA